MNQIKFMKYFVTNGEYKAKVHYVLGELKDGRTCVTLYAKEYNQNLGYIFPCNYQNNSDIMTDYFEKGRVYIFADDPLFEAAKARCRH